MRGMDGSGGNVAAVANAIRLRSAAHGEHHFAIENYVRGKPGMRVVGVEGVRAVLPHVGVRKTFGMKLRFQFALIHIVHAAPEL